MFALLVSSMESDVIRDTIVEETVCHAKQLINGLANPPSMGFQRVLRNLGLFLGLLTIGADRPIILDTLDLKRSLIDAIGEEDKFARVLPFLVNTLKASARSTVSFACQREAPLRSRSSNSTAPGCCPSSGSWRRCSRSAS